MEQRYGNLKKLPNSLSLFELNNGLCTIYIRYSKIHPKDQTFYGLRKDDLNQLAGHNSIICFLWDKQRDPVFIPYSEFEEIFAQLQPSSDGQIKAQIFKKTDSIELYLANAGRFNIEGFIGWDFLDQLIDRSKLITIPDYTHSQIQTMIGSIGALMGYDIWIPSIDRNKLDWNITNRFEFKNEIPKRYGKIESVIQEIDVLWLKRGASDLTALFEVEHSTPVYSGLLRFNDLHLIEPNLNARFNIVSNEMRRSLFLRQVNRETFRASGLTDLCSFMEYKDVFGWFKRTIGRIK